MQTVAVNKDRWDPARHKIWYYLNNQDDWYKIRNWPAWAQSLVTLAHKNDSQFYNIFVFLVVNGAAPGLALQWSRAGDVQGRTLVAGVYSGKELLDQDRIMDRWSAGTLIASGKRVFDMRKGRPEDVGAMQGEDSPRYPLLPRVVYREPVEYVLATGPSSNAYFDRKGRTPLERRAYKDRQFRARRIAEEEALGVPREANWNWE